MADDMVKLLDALNVIRADVVGWSDGGIVGLDMAMRYPQRVRRLVVIGANYDPDGLKQLPPAVPDRGDWSVLYRKVVTMWRTQPHYALAELARITAPTLVMAGEFDVVRRGHTDRLAGAIPGAEEAIILGGTHFVASQRPDAVNARIIEFLSRPAA